MRQLAYSLVALVLSLAFGLWMLSFTGVLQIGPMVHAQLGRVPLVADYISAYRKGVDLEQARRSLEEEFARREQELAAKLQQVEQRAAELDRMARELQARESELARREQAVARREAALTALEDRQRYYRELAEAVGRMRPDEAARVIQEVDIELARILLGGMDPRQAGAILGKLEPKYASQLLAVLNPAPVLPATRGGSGASAGP